MSPKEKADRAKLLLNDELLSETIARIREGFVRGLENSPMGDKETHNSTAIALQVLRQIDAQLTRYLNEAALLDANERAKEFLERHRETISPRR